MFATVGDDLMVANMVAQDGFPSSARPVAVDYEALRLTLSVVSAFCQSEGASVHMPRIGCGISGGSWDRVAQLVEETLCSAGVAVTVYDLPNPVTRQSKQ